MTETGENETCTGRKALFFLLIECWSLHGGNERKGSFHTFAGLNKLLGHNLIYPARKELHFEPINIKWSHSHNFPCLVALLIWNYKGTKNRKRN